MFVVVFVRKDSQADEIYYYNNEQSALYHLDLFRDDDSGLFSEIRVESVDTDD